MFRRRLFSLGPKDNPSRATPLLPIPITPPDVGGGSSVSRTVLRERCGQGKVQDLWSGRGGEIWTLVTSRDVDGRGPVSE